MSTVIGHTPDGREIVQHDPAEGLQFRCTTCDNWLYRQAEVRGHWLLFSEGHSVFEDRRGRTYHQTVEGLHRRDRPIIGCEQTDETENDGDE